MSNTHNDFLWTLKMTSVAIFLLVSIKIFANMDSEYEIELNNDSHYCEMHDIFIKSGGVSGWPDFDQKYDKMCK